MLNINQDECKKSSDGSSFAACLDSPLTMTQGLGHSLLIVVVVLMTEGCNSPLSGGSSGQTSSDDTKSNAAFIGATVAVFVIIVASVTTVVLLARRRRLKRQRLAAHFDLSVCFASFHFSMSELFDETYLSFVVSFQFSTLG